MTSTLSEIPENSIEASDMLAAIELEQNGSTRTRSFVSRTTALQSQDISYHWRLTNAMQMRETCHCERSTYEPLPSRARQRPHSLPQSPANATPSSRTPRRSLTYFAQESESYSARDLQRILQSSEGLVAEAESGTETEEGVSADTDWIDDQIAPVETCLGGSVLRNVDVLPHARLLGPVPVPVQEELCRLWIQRRIGRELDDRPLADALLSGDILHAVLNSGVSDSPVNPAIAWHVARHNLVRFLRIAKRRKLNQNDLFDAEDLLYRRNIPRVLRTIAAIARETDPEGFNAVATHLRGSRTIWTQADEPNEFWNGDWVIREVVRKYKQNSWRGGFSVVVAGSQGSGKSATVDLIMGRTFMPSSHAFSVVLDDDDFEEEELQLIQHYRKFRARNWPRRFAELGTPLPSDEVCKMYVKLSGISVQVIELPSMEEQFEGVDVGGRVLMMQTGKLSSVLPVIQSEESDLALLIERLDDFPIERFTGSCRKLQKIYGDLVWKRTIVILTHGNCLPPDNTTYDEMVSLQCHAILKTVKDVAGDPEISVPIVVVENSAHCPLDPETNRPVLPNGEDFKTTLTTVIQNVLENVQGSKPIRPATRKRWWEDYAIMAVVFLLLSRV